MQKKQLKTCFAQIYRVKEGDEIYNYLPCPSFDDLLSFRLMHKRREVNDDQHSPCTVLFVLHGYKTTIKVTIAYQVSVSFYSRIDLRGWGMVCKLVSTLRWRILPIYKIWRKSKEANVHLLSV